MAIIRVDHFSGQANVTPAGSSGSPGDDLASILRSGVDDVTALRTAVLNLATKLDADAGVTDTDYNTTVAGDLGTQQNTKG